MRKTALFIACAGLIIGGIGMAAPQSANAGVQITFGSGHFGSNFGYYRGYNSFNRGGFYNNSFYSRPNYGGFHRGGYGRGHYHYYPPTLVPHYDHFHVIPGHHHYHRGHHYR